MIAELLHRLIICCWTSRAGEIICRLSRRNTYRLSFSVGYNRCGSRTSRGDKLADFVLSEQNRDRGTRSTLACIYTNARIVSCRCSLRSRWSSERSSCAFADPHGDQKTLGDIILVYQLQSSSFDGFSQAQADVARALDNLNQAFSKLKSWTRISGDLLDYGLQREASWFYRLLEGLV